ncbi:hypothetical protein [Noviherbaspirillum pedocola]|uniref:NAD(P)/FAD-dependent oxidoreductase n=1 Tax=Noviherbaspirillum pedocola TaxID=2801341 RepID=A0A934W9L9_9BURK|nr:hypothetical protein [Noviherbaspirillum pedocola]MBK4739105.1 hypothetical protein [Noviherbaspirillum pedocola]
MNHTTTKTDYLVVGAGAAAMAFVDSMLSQSSATFAIVDRRARPGGHWNDAYPFVRLHQPSTAYGVNSTELGDGSVDAVGLNKGLRELASGAEVLDYFDRIMRRRFLPSGRVRYFPMCEHTIDSEGIHHARSLTSGNSKRFVVTKRIVDATHAGTSIPLTHSRGYTVAEGVECIPPNAIPHLDHPRQQYIVVGGGKTAMDTCLWLLQNDVEPSHIRWIIPRDAWLLDRANLQSGPEFHGAYLAGLAQQFKAIATASTLSDLYQELEERGQFIRLDRTVTPTMYHCATLSQAELAELRRICDIVRLGRVISIDEDRIILEQGETDKKKDAVVIDCSAQGLRPVEGLNVFDGSTVNLLLVRVCHPCFSAAFIGHIESQFEDEAEKNALCQPVPVPMLPSDYVRMWVATFNNRLRWGQYPAIESWLTECRLDEGARSMRGIRNDDEKVQAILKDYRASVRPAVENLPRLLAQI